MVTRRRQGVVFASSKSTHGSSTAYTTGNKPLGRSLLVAGNVPGLLETKLLGFNRCAWETRYIFFLKRPGTPHQRQSKGMPASL
jgi:hypothetical protein